MVREELKLCTLSKFIKWCTDAHYQYYENGKWVTEKHICSFYAHKKVDGDCKATLYEIMNIKLSGETLAFQLKSKDGIVSKSFSIYDVGWAHHTGGVMEFYYKTETGEEYTWHIS